MAFSKEERYSNETTIELIEKYKETGNIEIRNDIVMSYSYIAKSVANQLRNVTASYAQMEDIVNQGIIALIDCVEKFDNQKNVRFEAFAYIRLKGAVIDYVRAQDWIPRRIRKQAKEIFSAETEIQNEQLREATPDEIAKRLNISKEQLNTYYAEMSKSSLVSLDELYQGFQGEDEKSFDLTDNDSRPESGLFKKELKEQLVSAIKTLKDNEKTVISLYYYENLKLHEIAEVLGLTESRISQIHTKAIAKMKLNIGDYFK